MKILNLKNIDYRKILTLINVIIGFLFLLFMYFVENIEFELAIVDVIITCGLFILVTFALWYPSNYFNIESYSLPILLLNNFIIALLTSIFTMTLAYLIITLLKPNYETYYISTFSLRFSFGTLWIVIVIILNYVVIFYKNIAKKVLAESKLNSLIAEAELKSLKYQINPHFIFNSLNSISSLTITNPEKAQEMAINLSQFLRKILAGNDVKKVSLEE